MPWGGDADSKRRKAREWMQAWRKENAELSRAEQRAWRAANPEKYAAQKARKRAQEATKRDDRNADRRDRYDAAKASARRRAYYAANRERILAHRKARYAANPEPERARSIGYVGRRRARIRGLEHEKVDRADIIARDKSRCHLCGKRVAKRDLVLDHIVPIAVGGSHTAANLAVAHDSCNASKGARAANDQLRIVG